jgi:hypothetical protein
MPFVQRRNIALAAKTDADKKYKRQLRAALRTPGLSEDQRRNLQSRLDQVGKTRVYDAKSPPPPGAIILTPAEPARVYSRSELGGMKKAELVKLAGERGLPSAGTKANLVESLTAR